MKDVCKSSGRALKKPLTGILAKPNEAGQLQLSRVATLVNMSESLIKQGRRMVSEGNLGPLTMKYNAGINRSKSRVSDFEQEVTQAWLYRENSARSGDQRLIAWFVKNKEAFYHED